MLTKTSLQEANIEQDNDRPKTFIQKENRFENDIEILTPQILDEVFAGDDFDSK